jgi:biotin carboxyl carrier protein
VFSFDAGRVVAVCDGLRIAGRTALEGDAIRVEYDGGTFWFAPVAPPRLGGSSGAKGGHKKGSVSAPMPGKIVKVVVGEGDTVAERDLLVILEAMKMEHRIEAPHAGVVRNVAIAPGALVTGGAQLLEIG